MSFSNTLGTLLAAIATTFVVLPIPSSAHFVLSEPAARSEQNQAGDPQLGHPCGDEFGVPTGAVTAYQSGQTIDVTINETIFLPGHYRVALAVDDIAELPPDPVVTPGTSICGSAAITETPVLPILADGVLMHTQAFGGPQSFPVTLPDGVTCDSCTLQVIEFLSNHSPPCFRHHCANITIPEPDAVAASLVGLGVLAGIRSHRRARSPESGT
jgi:hypothetical protein